jgi:hypothetical protein
MLTGATPVTKPWRSRRLLVQRLAPVHLASVARPGKPCNAATVIPQFADGEVLGQSTGLTGQLPTWQLTWPGPTTQSLWVDLDWVHKVFSRLIQIPKNS